MKGVLHSSTNRLSIRAQIFIGSLILAAAGLITQTFFVTEIDAAKEYEVQCILLEVVPGSYEERYCCEYEVDTDTGEKRTIGCWTELCEEGGGCDIFDDPETKPTIDPRGRPLGEGEFLPVPPNTPGRDGGLTGRTPSQGEVLRTPPETTTQGETVITDPPTDEGGVQPTLPDIVKETTPLQQQQQQPSLTLEEEPETMPEPEECMEEETFNEQTGQCEPIEEPEAQELEETEQTEPLEQQSSEE